MFGLDKQRALSSWFLDLYFHFRRPVSFRYLFQKVYLCFLLVYHYLTDIREALLVRGIQLPDHLDDGFTHRGLEPLDKDIFHHRLGEFVHLMPGRFGHLVG